MDYLFNKRNWFDTEKNILEGFKLIDLSESITPHSEVPGEKGYSDPDVLFDTRKWVGLEIKPYYITKIVIGAHTGTHIDAPMHVKEDGDSIDHIPNEFVGPALIIEANDTLNDDRLQKALEKLDENKIVVIKGKSDYRMPADYRMQIIRANPRLVVFADCVNVDGVEDTIQYLNNDIPMVMGVNQAALNQISNGDILFVLPLKYVGIEAAPARVFALKLLLKEKNTDKQEYDFSVGDE